MLNSRFSILVIVIAMLVLLAACGPGNSSDTLDEECNKWGCVSIQVEQPVQWMKPVSIRLTAKSTQTVDGFQVSIYGSWEKLSFIKIPDKAEIFYEDTLSIYWRFDAVADQEYVFEGEIILPEPHIKEGTYDHLLTMMAFSPGGSPIITGMNIMLDGNGNQLSPAQVKEYLETEVVFLPIETGIIQFPTDTPAPTFPPPTGTPTRTATTTRTPTPTRTATLAPYP